MREKGVSCAAAHVVNDPSSFPEDRTYGIWDVDRAQRMGFAVEPFKASEVIQKDREQGGESWVAAEGQFYQQFLATGSDFLMPEDAYHSVASRVQSEAIGHAESDLSWQ